MTTATRREAPHHNTLTCYTEYGCRLPDCVRRKNTQETERERAQATGTWNVFVDATPTRKHIEALQAAGVPPYRIATASGVSIQSILGFIRTYPGSGKGRKQRTTPAMEARILAVTVDDTEDYRTAATATVRRLQALVAIGWPLKTIALRAGLHPNVPSVILRRAATEADPVAVFVSTEKKIEKMYGELRSRRPEKHGVAKSQTARCRNLGAANRWPKPKYWDKFPDAIGDPHFTPEYKVTQAEILAEETRWLIETAGLTRAEAAERLGKDKSYIDRVLRQADLKAAA